MTFQLIQTQQLPDIDSTGYLYEHEKTKAQVLYIKNSDINKAFSITFATPPYNHNGIAHIIEHSVLCGSRKYPTKEPFVELLKGSLSTFLNAMTFSDKTMYPVSSLNHQDFSNLMDVYLDAVFFPALVDNPLILAQEGWHYHLENEEDELIYKGVVYNEMKGALSNPDAYLHQEIRKHLFKDTIYAHSSGGDPSAIPTLTQEEFVAFHQTYYHPSNSQTFLYGDLDIDKALAHLDTYFDQFSYQSIDKQITTNQLSDFSQTIALSYPLDSSETFDNKTYLSLDAIVGESKDFKHGLQLSILMDILLGSDIAPLKKELLKAQISSDISGSYSSDGGAHAMIDIVLKGSSPEYFEMFRSIVLNTLQQIKEDGLSADLISASINKMKFSIAESAQGGQPKGIIAAINATKGWLYNGDVFSCFAFNQTLEELENNPSIFTQLIDDVFFNNPYLLWSVASPSSQDEQANEKQQLETIRQQLSKKELNGIIDTTHKLLERQQTPDSPENLATLPTLQLADIDPHIRALDITVTDNNLYQLLHHDVFTGGIHYNNLYFNLEHIADSDLPYIKLWASLLTQLRTTNYSLEKLTTQIDQYTGNISFDVVIQPKNNQPDDFDILLVAKGKAFHENNDKMYSLMFEMLHNTQFNQPNRIKEHLQQVRSQFEDYFYVGAHFTAFYRLRSYYMTMAKYEELINGIDYYRFICTLLDTFEEQSTDLITRLSNISDAVLNQQDALITSIGETEKCQVDLDILLSEYFVHIPNKPLKKASRQLVPIPLNEGFSMSQDVQYVAQGYLLNYSENFESYSGHWNVLQVLLNYTYLWNTVRIQGGAYGALTITNRLGDFSFVSYRDPNLMQTLSTYQETHTFIETLDISQEELDKMIIGTISQLDTPLSPSKQGHLAFYNYLNGITDAMRQKERSQVLNTTVADLHQLAPIIKNVFDQNALCVVGSADMLRQHKDVFNTIIQLIQ